MQYPNQIAAKTVIVCVGYEHEGEGKDRSFELPKPVEAQINQLVALNKSMQAIPLLAREH